MMLKIAWPEDPYAFLVSYEFGTFEGMDPLRAALAGKSLPPIPSEKREAAKAYRKKLEDLPIEEITRRVQTVVDEQSRIVISEAEKRDALSFFCQPHAAANYEKWVGLNKWSKFEAAALSLGKCPNVVNAESLASYKNSSLFAQQYFSRIALIDRDLPNESYFERIVPDEFLTWLQKNAIEYPAEFAEAIRAHSIENEGSSNQAVQHPQPKELSVREKETLLYLIATMAVQKYGYTPHKKNNAASRIVDDMGIIGVAPLSTETVRNKLREASDLVPQSYFKGLEK